MSAIETAAHAWHSARADGRSNLREERALLEACKAAPEPVEPVDTRHAEALDAVLDVIATYVEQLRLGRGVLDPISRELLVRWAAYEASGPLPTVPHEAA